MWLSGRRRSIYLHIAMNWLLQCPRNIVNVTAMRSIIPRSRRLFVMFQSVVILRGIRKYSHRFNEDFSFGFSTILIDPLFNSSSYLVPFPLSTPPPLLFPSTFPRSIVNIDGSRVLVRIGLVNRPLRSSSYPLTQAKTGKVRISTGDRENDLAILWLR